MKKALLFLPLMGVLWSCNKQVQPTPNPTIAIGKDKLKSFAAVDGVWDVLGYGYDVTGEFGNSVSTTFPVLDIAKLYSLEPDRVGKNPGTTKRVNFNYGQNASDYSHDLSSSLTATAGFGLFSGSITAAYKTSNSFSSKYLYGSYNIIIQQKELKINATPSVLQGYLNQTFLHDIQVLTPQQIVAQYGAFVLTDIFLGAKLDMTYQSETTSSNRTGSASAGLDASVSKVFSVKANINTDYTQSASNFNQTLRYVTHGGDPTKGIDSFTSFNQQVAPIDINPWEATCTAQNAELVDIAQNGLIPIYQLVADPTKAAALQTYVTQWLKDHQVQVTTQPVGIQLAEGQFTRNDDNGQVYIEMGGQLRYIPNTDVLNGLFVFNTNLMVHYHQADFDNFVIGTTISPDNGIIQDTNTGKVYFREKSFLRYIPSEQTRQIYHFNFKVLQKVNGISAYTVGPNM